MEVAHVAAEIVFHIFSFLESVSLCRAACVCRYWHEIAEGDELWRRLFVNELYYGIDRGRYFTDLINSYTGFKEVTPWKLRFFQVFRSEVYSWGQTSNGRLGIGSISDGVLSLPTRVEGLDGKRIVFVGMCEENGSCALSCDGTAYLWGRIIGTDSPVSFGQNIVGNSRVIDICAGHQHYVLITVNGEVYVLGENTFSQLGTDERAKALIPQKMGCLSDQFIIAGGCCAFTTVVQTIHNEVLYIGNNISAQFDIQSPKPCLLPIDSLKLKVKEIVCGYDDVVVITQEGDAFMWPQFKQLLKGKKIAQVALASYHYGLVTEEGECYTWGQNNLGQLGHGDFVDRSNPTRVEYFISESIKIIRFSCGADYHSGGHSAVLTADSQVYVFGRVESSMPSLSTPTLVQEFKGKKVLNICCGENFNTAIVAPRYYY